MNMTIDEIIEKIVLDKTIRTRGWVLINLPANIKPDEFFGRKAVDDIYTFYADLGIKPPRKKK